MNEIEIRKALDILKPIDTETGLVPIIEVRIIGDRTWSGYFRNIDNLIEAIKPYNNENIYFTLNEISEACYSRDQCEKIVIGTKKIKTTADNDISGRDYILIDIDPKRSSGVSASDEEVARARVVGNKVFKFLRDQGFTKPVSAFSGNGLHLLYKVDLANNAENTELVKKFLQTLDMLFSDENVDIDTSVYNAARITKLYGTFSRKGANTEDRPHRISKIISAPDKIVTLDKAFIQKVVNLYPKEEAKTWKNNYQGSGGFDIDEFISKHGITVQKELPFSGGTKLIIDCPFDSNHKGDGAIFKLNNGAIGYKCFHNSCQHHNWESFRNHFEPNRFDRKQISYNRRTDSTPPVEYKPQEESEDKGKKWKSFKDIHEKDRSQIVSIPTGLKELDDEIIGLNLGEVSLVTGINGSGKSALIKQIVLNAVDKGFKAGEYSGELDDTRSKNWTTLQAAGKQFVEPTKYANYFRVPENISMKITEWMDQKWFIYNNSYSNNLSQLIVDIEELLSKEDISIIIIDNIMSLDIDELGYNLNEQQKQALKAIHRLAVKHRVHIVVVAHPNKSMTFLRKENISGSGDISNLVENIFIVHRVNNDFQKRFPEFIGQDKAAPYFKYGNVLEVAKNRDLGVVDFYVGLYYEIESKRFLNDFTDNPNYGWQDTLEEAQSEFSFHQPSQAELEASFFSEPTPPDQLPF